MSGTLRWTPMDKGGSLPNALMVALKKRFEFPLEFSASDYSYIKGLCDAGVEGAEELQDLIDKHGTVQLSIDY